jgi:hypothetical protein
MAPTLRPDRSVIGLCWFHRLRPGDVIIFEHEGREKIKRVTAVAKNGQLYARGEQTAVSRDSRHFGAIDRSSVTGKVVWPRIKPKA